ncbi:MAG: thiamine phosphate synthase [Halomonas sp.]|nr:thiamine phosphate synthase [Halomonas sp.]
MSLDLSLYLVTDPELCARQGLVETVVAAVRGGVTVVQLRDKQASDGEMIDQARRLKAALAGSGVPLIINDRLAVALESGADGLHIGQDDGDVAAARSALGEAAILGLSVQNHDQLARLDPARLDYLGFGPVFATTTKRNHATPLGFDGLAALVAASPLPAVAIGGLKAEHARQVHAAGAQGPAVISAICGQPDPEAAARAFLVD